MPITAPHLSYEEVGSGRVRWTIQERDYYQNDSGLWREPDLSDEELVGGWRIFRSSRVVIAINESNGKVRIAPDRHDLNKYVQFDFGLSLSFTAHKDYIDIWREITAWGTGSGFKLRVHGRGLKLLIKFTDKTVIPDTVQFGLTASGLTFDGRRVMDGGNQIFRMPDLFAYADSDPDNHVGVPESLSGEIATVDLSAVKPQFAGTTEPWYVDPSIEISPTSKDTCLYQNHATTTYGSSAGMNVYVYTTTILHHSILSFDISSIMSPISSASLNLFVQGYFGGGPLPVGYYVAACRMTELDWVEGEATWNDRKASTPWPTLGGDYTVANKALSPRTIGIEWQTWDVKLLLQDMKAMSQNTADILLKVDDESRSLGNVGPSYATKEYSTPLYRPKLDIVTESTGVYYQQLLRQRRTA